MILLSAVKRSPPKCNSSDWTMTTSPPCCAMLVQEVTIPRWISVHQTGMLWCLQNGDLGSADDNVDSRSNADREHAGPAEAMAGDAGTVKQSCKRLVDAGSCSMTLCRCCNTVHVKPWLVCQSFQQYQQLQLSHQAS